MLTSLLQYSTNFKYSLGGCKKQYITKRLLLKCYSSYLSSSDTFYDILSDFAQIHGEPRWHTKIQGSKTGPCSNLTTSHVTRENTVGCVTNKTHGLVNIRHLLTASLKRKKNQNDKLTRKAPLLRPADKVPKCDCGDSGKICAEKVAQKYTHCFSVPRAVTSSWGRKNKRKLTRRFSSAPTKCSWAPVRTSMILYI